MSKHANGSYSHKIQKAPFGGYWISWVVDFHYSGSRLRFPRSFRRYTEKEGAERFSKKWGVPMPAEKEEI